MKIKYFALAGLIALTVIVGLDPNTAIAENSTTITIQQLLKTAQPLIQ
jgi:hypothetical protein